MKRVLVWLSYAVGAISVIYLALFAYATLVRPEAEPNKPIHIYEREDAPRHG